MLRDYQDLNVPVEPAPTCEGAAFSANHAESTSASRERLSDTDHRVTQEKLVGAKEVAHWLGVSRAWVFEHSNGRRRPFLSSVKLGKSVRYRPLDVDAFIIECERFSRRGAAQSD